MKENNVIMMENNEYYDIISDSYDGLHHEEQANKIAIIRRELKPGDDDILLDLGAGPGYLELDCTIVRLDPSIRLLKQSKTGYCVLGKAESLPFKDNCFDYVVSITAMQNFNDIKKALSEIKRVARADSDIIISFLKRSGNADKITGLIKESLDVIRTIEEEKDIILIARNS
ncbi:methyltransferase domain-containing protein [Candidatus Woesearchaeota archaeon]|nr:methyltransferase domain-containing protein [Candidatus Woesearchaeota archaeon]